jgi:hypothetical protein
MKEIKLFGKALNTKTLSPIRVNELAVLQGYLVHPDCCNQRVINFLQSLPNNYNTTFYQSVSDVIDKSRFALYIDQIVHYTSTYGTEHQGTPYIPNQEFGAPSTPVINFADCKVITPITVEQIEEKVCEMLYSGIALKQDTIEDLVSLIDEFEIQISVNSVKNIEAKMYFFKKYSMLPYSAEEMVRYLVYLHTGNTLLIKSPETLRLIMANPMSIESLVDAFGIEKLASVFFRYKPLFLAMKCDANKKTINKLRRLADKHHKPFVAGYWETVLSKPVDGTEFFQKIGDLSNFKKVRLIKAIDERLSNPSHKLFIIRNGKTHTEPVKPRDTASYSMMHMILRDQLIEELSKKACKVCLPTDIRLAIPSSQKTFVGNIPFGSYILPSRQNSIFGITWRGEDGAQDLDLAYTNLNGDKIGWNSSYYSDNQDIVYSGDMTYANPEACEYMFCKTGLADGIITVNSFSAEPNSKCNFFVGNTDEDFTVTRGTVSQDVIKFNTQLTINGETSVGFYIDGKIYFTDLNTGKNRVSCFTPKMRESVQYFVDTKDTFLYWDDVLTAAGFEFTDRDNCDIDLSNGDIATMISLLS